MAITRASGNAWLGAETTGNTSISVAFANNVQAGSLLVAVGFVAANETLTFSDGVNTWVSNAIRFNQGNLTTSVQIGYAVNAAAGATTVQQASAANTNRAIYICEYLGAVTSSPVDGTPVSAGADGSSSNPDPGAITSTGGAVFIGAGVLYPTGAATPGSGYTGQIESTAWSFYQVNVEDQIFTTPQTSNHPKYNSNFDYWGMVGIALKAAGGSNIDIDLTEGGITVAGQTVNSNQSLSFTLTNGAIVVAGQSVSQGTNSPLTNGALVVAGQAIGSQIDIDVGSGYMTIGGQSVTSSTTSNINISISTQGAIGIGGQAIDSAISGGDIDFEIDTAGAITVAGQSVDREFGQPLSNGSMTFAGQTVTGLTSYNFPLSNGDISIIGQFLAVQGGGATEQQAYRDGRRRGRDISLYGRG